MKTKNKRALQMSFSWIFAIVVGIFILFLALYGATKIINTGQQATSAQAGKEILILTDPLETSFQEGRVSSLSLPVETRINNTCNSPVNNEIFGFQGIIVYQKSFGKWTKTDIESSFENKYIFSEKISEGKNFILFSKPFEFPFKIADLIYLIPLNKNYCFVDSPERIKNEISDLKPDNIFTEECPDNSIQVCFKGGECDINVNENPDFVEKRGEIVYYEGDALEYAAIFSDKDIYECQVQRLIARAQELAFIYDEKQTSLLSQECSPEVNVLSLISALNSINSSKELIFVRDVVKNIKAENNQAECRLW